MTEQWLPVPGYEGLYEVSDLGRVRSLYFDPPRLNKFSWDSHGYPVIMLSKDGKRRPFTLHRIVCRAFHGEAPPDRPEASHLDGDQTNARASNLGWFSKVENESHKMRHGTRHRGERSPCAKLTDAAVAYIRSIPKFAADLKALGRQYGVSWQTVSALRCGKGWPHIAPPPSPEE